MISLKTAGNRKFILGVVIGSLLATGTAVGASILNTPEGGYLLCVNKTTKAVTYPAAQKCPTGFTRLVLGARGLQGETGAVGEIGAMGPIGPTGAPGAIGAEGKPGLAGKDGAPGAPGGSGSSGPAGAQGSAGFFKVYDKNNELVGTLLGSSYYGTTFDVITPGGYAQSYDINGSIIQPGIDVWFLDSNCSGTPYVETRALYRSLGDGAVDFNQRMYSAIKPLVMLKGIETYNSTNNFQTDKTFVPASESRTATTFYTVADYMSNSQILGCYPYQANSNEGRLAGLSEFDLTELLPFTGTLRHRFVGSLRVA
jgi:hypothetical protein